MSKKEEKAYEYSKKISNLNPKIKDFVECSFMVGWDCALRNQWIRLEEKLPNDGEFVFILVEGEDDLIIPLLSLYNGGKFLILSKYFKVIAWMPIPSFDEILELNKDVLKRLKNK